MLEIACVKEDNIEYILLMIMDSFLVQDSVHGMVYKSALSAYHITGHQTLTLNPTPLLKKGSNSHQALFSILMLKL